MAGNYDTSGNCCGSGIEQTCIAGSGATYPLVIGLYHLRVAVDADFESLAEEAGIALFSHLKVSIMC